MTLWLKFNAFLLGFDAVFVWFLYRRVRLLPRPVTRIWRVVPTWALLVLTGLVLSLPVALPILKYFRVHAAQPGITVGWLFCSYVALAVLWGVGTAMLVRRLYSAGGALSAERIEAGDGVAQRVARKAFGPEGVTGFQGSVRRIMLGTRLRTGEQSWGGAFVWGRAYGYSSDDAGCGTG